MELLTNFVIIHSRVNAIAKSVIDYYVWINAYDDMLYRPLVPRIMSTVLAFVVKEFASSVKALQDPPENLVLQVPYNMMLRSVQTDGASCNLSYLPFATQPLPLIACRRHGIQSFLL